MYLAFTYYFIPQKYKHIYTPKSNIIATLHQGIQISMYLFIAVCKYACNTVLRQIKGAAWATFAL